MEQTATPSAVVVMTKKDTIFSTVAGAIIGLLAMPVLKAAKPDLYEAIGIWLVPFFIIGTPFGLYVAHLLSKKLVFLWQFAKFFVTGIMNALVDLGVLAMLTFAFRQYFNIKASDIFLSIGFAITFYSIYKSVSFIVSNINSYYWNKYWTFHKEGDSKTSEFAKFFIVSIIGFVINVVVASLVFGAGHSISALSSDQWGLIGAASGSVAGLVWNFLGYKFLVFKK